MGAADEQIGQHEGAGNNSYRGSAVKTLVWLAADPWALGAFDSKSIGVPLNLPTLKAPIEAMWIDYFARLTLSAAFLLGGCAASEVEPAAGEAEHVYAVLLAERHDGADSLFLLIQRETVDGNQPLPPVEGGVPVDYTELAQDSLSALEDETLNSFKSRNSRQVRIDSIPGLEIPHALRFSSLLNARSPRGILGSGVPSDTNPTGIVHLSPVGFNRAGTQALVYAEYYCGNPCGYGEYALLTKVEGRWRISDSVSVFVS